MVIGHIVDSNAHTVLCQQLCFFGQQTPKTTEENQGFEMSLNGHTGDNCNFEKICLLLIIIIKLRMSLVIKLGSIGDD